MRPTLSVIVPTFNRSSVLRLCLEALGRQTAPPGSFDVVVADDGSTDDTERTVRSMTSASPFELRYFRQENAGPSRARNRAVGESQAPLVLFVNDDTIAEPGMVEHHLSAHAEEPAPGVAVLGRITLSPEVERNLFTDLHLDASFDAFEGRAELDWRGFVTCNLSLKRDFLLEEGLFQEGLFPHEDLELGERLSHRGLRVLYRPGAKAHHHHALDAEAFLRSARKDGRALAIWYRKSPHLHDELTRLGLQGAPPLRSSWKNRLAERTITTLGVPALARVAARTRAVEPVARFLYRRLYQQVRREAIAEELRGDNGTVDRRTLARTP